MNCGARALVSRESMVYSPVRETESGKGGEGRAKSDEKGGLHVRTDLLLLHELRVGAVIDNIPTKDRSGENSVDLLGVDVAKLAVEDKLVALGSHVDGGLLAEQDEGKDVAVL